MAVRKDKSKSDLKKRQSGRGLNKDGKRTLHMIGNAHIDPVWLWRLEEGVAEVRATFRSALDRMKEYPDFTFTSSSILFFQWIEEIDPEMFGEIQRRVKEGRWEIVGGWLIQPDCNLPCGEAFVRQGLYGQRYLLDKFGITATVGYNPDSFGHTVTLPQILAKSGLKNYIFFRPAPDECLVYLRRIFKWQSPDGSSVVVCRPPFFYNNSGPSLKSKMTHREVISPDLYSVKNLIMLYGVGNHGGGPTIENIETISAAQNGSRRLDIRFSRLDRFFETLREDEQEIENLPILDKSLWHHAVGCYSANSVIKSLNRECENLLLSAERLIASLGFIRGYGYSNDLLKKFWEDLLLCQFHDVLPGSSRHAATQDSVDMLRSVRSNVRRILFAELQKVSRRIKISNEADGNIVIYNPLPWARKAHVREYLSPMFRGKGEQLPSKNREVQMRDYEGNEIPAQTVRGGYPASLRFEFIADLPPLGYKSFSLTCVKKPDIEKKHISFQTSTDSIENHRWNIRANSDRCGVSIYDKKHEVLVGEGLVLPVIINDQADTWGHNVVRFDDKPKELKLKSVNVERVGEVSVSLRLVGVFGSSRIEEIITIFGGNDDIECNIFVNWQQRHKVLKLGFNTRVENPEVTVDTAYGSELIHEADREFPLQKWIDITGTISDKQNNTMPYGVAVINNSKYAADVSGGNIRLTVLRSPEYSHHVPNKRMGSALYRVIDQGWHEFEILLCPHLDGWRENNIPHKAYEFNEKVFLVQEYAHKGDLAGSLSLVDNRTHNVVLSVVKESEEKDGYVVRGYEAHGEACTWEFALPTLDRTYSIPIGAHEIKTLKITPMQNDEWKEVNLIEMDDV